MPSRLVYAPKVYAYTKAQNGATYNLSRYVVSGKVERKINQVSTAQITLRNPYKIFTGGQGQPRAFHPMDPITIYLERVQNHPVRVFTGYLDTTPYLQMYPGTISLSASCTLKKLLYSYFDPSLPYVIAFFEQYGWINTGKGSIISIPATKDTANQAAVDAGQKPFTDLKDGSLAKLLWAVLTDIGQWDDKQIYIENLPSGANGIAARVEALMKSVQSSQAQAQSDFTSFLQAVIGAGSQGSAGATGTGVGTLSGNTNAQKVFNYFVQQGFSKAGAAGIIGNWQQESAVDPTRAGGYIAQWGGGRLSGLEAFAQQQGKPVTDLAVQLAWTMNELNGSYNSILSTLKTTTSATEAATQFCNVFEEPGAPNEMGPPVWLSRRIQYANDAYNAFANSATATNQLTNATNQQDQPGSTAPSDQAISGSYVNPFAKAKNVRGERYDQGVDYVCDPGSPIVALGDCTYDGIDPSWYTGQPLITFVLTSGPLKGCRYYYAEGIQPPTYPQGTSFKAGQQVTTTTSQPSGLEFGWASNTPGSTATYAQSQGATSDVDSVSLNSSHMWGRLMKVLGAPLSSGGDPGPGPVSPNGVKGGQISAGGAAAGGGTATSNGTAQAFVTELNFPSIEDQVAAIALGAEHKGLMHDQPLMPFVQQIAQASLRSFQSLPDGSFYGFYPDYFGEFSHHNPYWQIDDLEVLSGGINLSDDSLATHVFAVGDNTWPANQELINMLFSSGAINIFNAFVGNGIIDTKSLNKRDKKKKTKNGLQSDGLDPGIIDAEEAVAFIQRYGARPLVQDYPTVRNPIFEMLLAYQQFMFAWSNQFKTPFTFTFMPELFPGGKVAFRDHGIMMYINSVTHEFNYSEGGFTTTAEMSAPSVLPGVDPADYDLPPLMVTALVEPIKQAKATSTATAQQEADKALTKLSSIVDSAVQAFSL